MTEQPPGPPPENYPQPPPGASPPPPPPQGGYPPAPGHAYGTLPQDAYTSWFTRVVAWVIDYLPYLVVVGIGYGIEAATQSIGVRDRLLRVQPRDVYCHREQFASGVVAFGICLLIGLAYLLWNYGYRQGTTGSSIGKSIMKFKVVSEKTGQPIGFGLSIVRQLAHFVDAVICYIGYLFPLWDSKRQTLADKIMTTVCLPL